VQKVRHQDDVVAGSVLDGEGVTGYGPIAVVHAGRLRVLLGETEDRLPVERDDLRPRIPTRQGDAERPVTRGDVEEP
jgi:hypothetical protein